MAEPGFHVLGHPLDGFVVLDHLHSTLVALADELPSLLGLDELN